MTDDRFNDSEAAHRLTSGLWVVGDGESVDIKKTLLIAEIDSSISFLNVEFVVCTALLLFNLDALSAAPLAGVAIVVAVIALLFGGLSVANAGGALARGGSSFDDVEDALNWGNIYSEWFGVYMLVFSLPAIVEVSSASPALGYAAVTATVLAFTGYTVEKFDILHRLLEGKPRRRRLTHLLTMLGVVMHWAGVALDHTLLANSGGAAFGITVVYCAALHAQHGEFASRRSRG